MDIANIARTARNHIMIRGLFPIVGCVYECSSRWLSNANRTWQIIASGRRRPICQGDFQFDFEVLFIHRTENLQLDVKLDLSYSFYSCNQFFFIFHFMESPRSPRIRNVPLFVVKPMRYCKPKYLDHDPAAAAATTITLTGSPRNTGARLNVLPVVINFING